MLRLHHDGVSTRAIGRTLGVARSTILDNLRRAQASGIDRAADPGRSHDWVYDALVKRAIPRAQQEPEPALTRRLICATSAGRGPHKGAHKTSDYIKSVRRRR
jgi:IS30 family transposase